MPTLYSHSNYCRGKCCVAARAARAEAALLATMTFAERKAYRVAKRAK